MSTPPLFRASLRSPRREGRGRLGFTLVELLTVIAIIGVLAAILFPVLGRVREAAKSSACANNLRQIGIAIQGYVNDNKGSLPPGGAWITPSYDADPRNFQAALVPYLGLMKTSYWGRSDASKMTYSPTFDCPGYKGESPLAARYAFQPNETDYDGITKLKPWGFVYQAQNGQFLTAPKPLKYAAVPAKNKALADAVPSGTTPPNHSGYQNTLYFDWHVDRVAAAN